MGVPGFGKQLQDHPTKAGDPGDESSHQQRHGQNRDAIAALAGRAVPIASWL